jgi:hypothetical protein
MKRVAVAAMLYPFAFLGALAIPAVVLPAAAEGAPSILLLVASTFAIGVVAGRWWALLVPLGWAATVLLLGFSFPFENSDGVAGRLLLVGAVVAGIVPLALGVAVTRAARRSGDGL